MLTPEYYDSLSDDVIKLYSDLDNAIVSDMVRRLLKNGEITETAKWQAKQLQESGMLYDDILREISKRSGKTEAQVRKLFENAGIKVIENDNVFYKLAGKGEIRKFSPAVLQTLNAGYIKCLGEMNNLTLTTANTSQQAYITACNNAYMQITSGAFDYNTAIRNAVKAAASDGTEVLYPSGHHDKLDVAVRRSVLTGVGQTARKISELNARDMECDLMEITAHAGARPSHAEWQGKIVSLSGRNGYLSTDDIGYGTGEGFGGWNCRHDWYPFFEGISTRAYSDDYLEKLDEPCIEYNGEMYTEYEISQMQRKYERDIRQLKREAVAADTAMNSAGNEALYNQFSEDFNKASVKLKKKEGQLKDFLAQTKQLPDNARTQVIGFGRSMAQKAVWAEKKSPISLTDFIKNSKIEEREKLFRDYLKLGKINTAVDDSQQNKHLQTKVWKNQVKQTILGNDNGTPRSRLNKGIDPQELIRKYSGTGKIVFSGDGKTVNEYITLPNVVGVTFDKKIGKFKKANVIQIKYTEKGTHVFPTTPRKEK